MSNQDVMLNKENSIATKSEFKEQLIQIGKVAGLTILSGLLMAASAGLNMAGKEISIMMQEEHKKR